MPELVPVDHDPFVGANLVPVDHDPFAPTMSPAQQVAGQMQNVGPAASQGVTPDVSQHQPNLVSADTFENDAGEVQYRDPKTGEMKPTDSKTQIAIRDPSDNRVKVFSRSEATAENPVVSASRILSQGLISGAPTTRAGLATNMRAPSGVEIKTVAKSGYEAARGVGVEVNPGSVKNLSGQIQGELNISGINEVLAPKVFAVLKELETIPAGATFTVDNFRTLQRTLGNAAKSADPTERLAAVNALRSASKFMEDIPAGSLRVGTPEDANRVASLIKEANANYGAAKRSELVQEKLKGADLNAGSANSGQNLDNAIRQQVKTFLKNKKLQQGLSPEELKQMASIVRGTAPGNVVRAIGNAFGGGLGIGAVGISMGGAAATGNALGAAIPLVGYGVKQLGNFMTARQAARLDNLVRSRAPLARATEDWGNKHEAFVSGPTASSYSAFALSSRNLVNNLKDAGINISVRDILRSMQTPKSAADNDEQGAPGTPP